MCGICGFVGKTDNKNDVINNMMRRIEHRGPDQSGSYTGSAMALGFRRLSIVDLAHGMQPMYNEDNSIAIVFNGEIYNFAELRNELKNKRHNFANRSDTEVLVHGYEEYGTDLLNRLRGMFSFAIWDSNKNKLFAARDFFGIKPFYYSIINGVFVFASEIKSILEYPGCKREVNERALEQYLSFQYSPLKETFLKGIYKLEPGHYLTYQDGKLEINRFWSPDLSPDEGFTGDKAVDEIERSLKESVDAHLTGDVEIASFLSSGVDSSYIAKHSGCKKTFTVGFSEGDGRYSEIPYAKKFADQMDMKNYSRLISSEDFFDAVPKVLYHMDEPLADASAVALYFVNKEASKHVKVVLSGEGSDELMGGYRIYNESLDLKWFKRLPKSFRRAIGGFAKILPNMKGKNYLIRGSRTLEERYIGNANIFSKEEKDELLKNSNKNVSPQNVTERFFRKAGNLDDYSKMQYIDLNLWLVGDILLKADKMSMAHSMELRVPFLDKKVFETSKRLPLSEKSKNHVTKYAFRKAAEKSLPLSTAQKRKLGFPVPIRVWLKQEEYLAKIKTAFTGAAAQKYFNVNLLLKLLYDHETGKADNSRKIWTVFTFLVWHEIFIEKFETLASTDNDGTILLESDQSVESRSFSVS